MADFQHIFAGVNKFIIFFIKKLRLGNPWNYKVPFLICIPYLIFLLSENENAKSLPAILASLCVIIGVAGIGYLTNDLGDKDKDLIINKENVGTTLSKSGIILLFILFFAFALLPWFYLPFNKVSAVLLLSQLALFFAYAFPPFRLKERGYLGVITDSLYAHALPAVLAAYTFCLFTNQSLNQTQDFVAALFAWQFVLGQRNILLHQLKDYSDDLATQTKTFVTQAGIANAEKAVKSLLVLELFFFLFFAALINYVLFLFLPVVCLFWLLVFLRSRRKVWNYREIAYHYLDDLYIKWIPLIVLTGLVIKSVSYLPLLILHGILFRSELKTWFVNLISRAIKKQA